MFLKVKKSPHLIVQHVSHSYWDTSCKSVTDGQGILVIPGKFIKCYRLLLANNTFFRGCQLTLIICQRLLIALWSRVVEGIFDNLETFLKRVIHKNLAELLCNTSEELKIYKKNPRCYFGLLRIYRISPFLLNSVQSYYTTCRLFQSRERTLKKYVHFTF